MTTDHPGRGVQARVHADGQTDRGWDARVLALLRVFLRSLVRAGRNPAETAGEALEGVARSFHRRLVSHALADPRALDDQHQLLRALVDHTPSVAVNSTTTALVARKVLQRVGPLKMLARRTPWLMAASALPGAYASIAHGAEEVTMVASFLVRRARRAGIEPDADRVRRVTVQLLQRRAPDADTEPDHRELVWSWIRRATRQMLPFARRRGTTQAKRLVDAAILVDPNDLGRPRQEL